MIEQKMRLKAGRFWHDVTLFVDEHYIYIKFKFNRTIINFIKTMAGCKWLGFEKPPKKLWRIANNPRNWFNLQDCAGINVFEKFEQPISEQNYIRPLYSHQRTASDFMLAHRFCIYAGDMGVGKTLAAIEVMERSGLTDWWYVAPKSACYSVDLELEKWESKLQPQLMTYENLVKRMKTWDNANAPQGIIFDEAQKIKTPTSQRSQAAMAVANGIRIDWENEGRVILMSGTPAPKDPGDWWHLCEVVAPGFILEGTRAKFRNRLAIISVQEAYPGGGSFPKIVTWLDDEKKCNICGQYEEEHACQDLDDDHIFTPSVNEVLKLDPRLKDLRIVQMKRDHLDLPDKIYRHLELEPTRKILQVAKSITANARSAAVALIRLRELSDGFQYKEVAVGKEGCTVCQGLGKIGNPMIDANIPEDSEPKMRDPDPMILCPGCGGAKTRNVYERTTIEVECPKDEAIRDILDQHIDIGRLVIYAGFMASIDRIIKLCHAHGWGTIRVDSRGWLSTVEERSNTELIKVFQRQLDDVPLLAFVGNPGSASTGLTLTASPTTVYYSNDFVADNRMQSEDRIHRLGMDTNVGATIIDLLHLPSDYFVLENLKKKRQLQAMSLGDLQNIFKEQDD